jgi:hypothetical protein
MNRQRLTLLITAGSVLVAVVAVAAGAVALVMAARRNALREPPEAAGFPAGEIPPDDLPGLVLPDVTGLAGPAAAGPETVNLMGRHVPRITILVEKDGTVTAGKLAAVSPWRGVNLPRDMGPPAKAPVTGWPQEFIIKVGAAGGEPVIQAGGKPVADLGALGKLLAEKRPGWVVIDAQPATPFGLVAGAIAAAVERDHDVEFRTPPAFTGGATVPAAPAAPARPAVGPLIALESVKHTGPDGLSTLGVRIRADARAPWASVEAVLMDCMQAKVWRISFAAMAGGREVVIGRVESPGPGGSPGAVARPVDIAPERPVENPVVTHEETDVPGPARIDEPTIPVK